VLKYRFQWNFPIFFSPHNPKRLYAAGNHLFVTENEGQSWQEISRDLTTNDKSKQGPSGGPITSDNTSVEYYCTIFTATESALEKDLLWAGSDDGLIHVSKDGGKNWQNVTPPAAGKWMMWNSVEADPFKKGKAYFVGTKYKTDDYTPYIFKTEDYGRSWQLITNGINKLHFARTIRADKKVPGLLYAGTEFGMYISYDDGSKWKKFQLNLPIVSITDLLIKENDLVVGTQGRSIWILDDLSLVQQRAGGGSLSKRLHVLSVNDAYRTEGTRNLTLRNVGTNPPNGVVFNYFLKDASDSSKVSITIFDKKGNMIRTFSRDARDTTNKIDFSNGINQFIWDMQYPAAEKVEGMILWNGTVGAAKAAPGRYTARFRYVTDSTDVPFIIKADPNYKMTEAEYDQQVSFLLKVSNKFSEVQRAIKDIRLIRSQVNDFTTRADSSGKDLKPLADSINKKITAVEEALYQTKAKSGQDVLNYPIRLNDKISGLFDYASSGNNPPSQQAIESFAYLSKEADKHLAILKQVMQNEVKQFNQLIYRKMLPVIGVK
jgi:hypothetical protein